MHEPNTRRPARRVHATLNDWESQSRPLLERGFGPRDRRGPHAASAVLARRQYALVLGWPSSRAELVATQLALASALPPPWRPTGGARVGGCFVCFERGQSGPGHAGDRAWAGAALAGAVSVIEGAAGSAYEAGALALREGPLLEAAVRALAAPPEVLLVNATGRDHPRRAGLALHLGSVLDLPTVGLTHRTLVAAGEWPRDECGAQAPLLLEGDLVGYWLRTKRGTRPLAVHAAWRTDPETAAQIVVAATGRARTPEPLRLARRAARVARANSQP